MKKIDWMPKWADIKQCLGAMLRSTGIGFFLGLLPGCAPAVTTFVAYDVEKRVSKHPEDSDRAPSRVWPRRRGQ